MIQDSDQITTKIAMQLITNISVSTAWRKISVCKSALSITKPQILTVKKFKEYYGL